MLRLWERIINTLPFLCVLALLASCTPGGDTQEDVPPPEVTPETGVSAAPSPEATEAPPTPQPEKPDYALSFMPYVIENIAAVDIEQYSPGTEVFPLVNTPVIYKSCIDGPVGFVDQDGRLIVLPDGVVSYYTVYQINYGEDNWTRKPQCIQLVNGQNKVAVMRMDGTMATGFEYDLYYGIGEDYPDFQVQEGYLIVAKKNRTYELGLLDIRTGQLVIPCIYERLELCGSGLYAETGGTSKLLDFTGAELLDFGNRIIGDGVVYSNTNQLALQGDSYIIFDASSGISGVYRTYHDASVTVFPSGNLNLLVKNIHEENCVVTVVDADGEYLFAARGLGFLEFWIKDGSIIIDHDDILTAVTPDGRVLDFQYSAGLQSIYEAWYQDGAIHARLALDYYQEELRIIRPDGEYTAERFIDEVSNVSVVYRESGGVFEAAYQDDSGTTVIPFGLYIDFYELETGNGDVFVLVYAELGEAPSAVYDKNGKLLIDEVFGVIDELSSDKLVVYRSPEDCGLLSYDGTYTPIEGAPAVTLKYYGG